MGLIKEVLAFVASVLTKRIYRILAGRKLSKIPERLLRRLSYKVDANEKLLFQLINKDSVIWIELEFNSR